LSETADTTARTRLRRRLGARGIREKFWVQRGTIRLEAKKSEKPHKSKQSREVDRKELYVPLSSVRNTQYQRALLSCYLLVAEPDPEATNSQAMIEQKGRLGMY
jgi:hypothetical protein